MFGKAFDDIALADLQALVDARIPEGRRTEFKRDHYGRTDDARREFAADISAMANALGGYLLIGIDEVNGIATRVVGVESEDPDQLVRAITEAIRTSTEPPILGTRIRWIETETDRGVLMIQIDRSWSAPHRVTVARDNRFFIRDENGKHPMGVNELRRAFLFASEVEDRIRKFRADRIQLLIENEGPLAVDLSEPRVILHLVPQASFTDGIQLQFEFHENGIRPIGASGWNSMYSIDGFVTYSGPEGQFDSVRAFSTLFRNGTVEAVAKINTREQDGRRVISLLAAERYIIDAVADALQQFGQRSIPPPYYLMLSLVGVHGFCAPTDEFRSSPGYSHRTDKVLLPEFTIANVLTTMEPASLLRPLCDLIWNAFGQRGSPSYDADGNYRRR